MIDVPTDIAERQRWLREARAKRHPRGLVAALSELQGAEEDDTHRAWAQAGSFRVLAPAELERARFVNDEQAALDIGDAAALATLDGELILLMDDPWQADVVRRVTQRHGGLPEVSWVPKRTIEHLRAAVIERGGTQPDRPPSARPLERAREAAGPTTTGLDEGRMREISAAALEAQTSEVVRVVDRHLLDAWEAGASDVHFEARRTGMSVKYRLDGVLVPTAGIERTQIAEQVVNRLKVLAQLDIAETRIPQDGRFRASLNGRPLDFRVSVMPSIFGEDVVVRLLDKATLRSGSQTEISLSSLGFDPQCADALRRVAAKPHGMLLVTGPTGSGKTTTLYALLAETSDVSVKTVTIEDPVEYELPEVLQIPVNERKGLTFSKGLRSILRHDPDRILVGEIRDAETADIAVQAALTGHSVLSTVHANSIYDVIGRFRHMQIDLFGFASALNGVVVQRLLRRTCPACGGPTREPAGCSTCRFSGYRGRLAVAEVIPVDGELRDLIVAGAPIARLTQCVEALDVLSIRQAAQTLIERGLTTATEVRRVLGE